MGPKLVSLSPYYGNYLSVETVALQVASFFNNQYFLTLYSPPSFFLQITFCIPCDNNNLPITSRDQHASILQDDGINNAWYPRQMRIIRRGIKTLGAAITQADRWWLGFGPVAFVLDEVMVGKLSPGTSASSANSRPTKHSICSHCPRIVKQAS
jgi:hypothetical protein